jgi:hypothetical protein
MDMIRQNIISTTYHSKIRVLTPKNKMRHPRFLLVFFTFSRGKIFNVEALKMALSEGAPKSVVGQFTMTTTS